VYSDVTLCSRPHAGALSLYLSGDFCPPEPLIWPPLKILDSFPWIPLDAKPQASAGAVLVDFSAG